MKKTLILGMALLLAACACQSERCPLKNRTEATVSAKDIKPAETNRTEVTPVMYEGNVQTTQEEIPLVHETMPTVVQTAGQETTDITAEEVTAPAAVSGTYGCAVKEKCQMQEPIVLKPRVKEYVGAENRRPCCDDDDSWMPSENAETYVPDAPEIYVIAANRAFNTMQEEAAPLFKQIGRMKVYLDKAEPKSDDLPGGIEKGMEIIKKRLEQTDKVTLVKNEFVADYKIGSTADWYDTPTKTVPAIKYDITFKDRGDNLIGEWSEIIHQAEGDRSWW